MRCRLLISAAASCWMLACFATGAGAEELVDFNDQIRPILSDTCYACHGPDEESRATELRLDTREGALADLGGYRAIEPDKPEDSELWRRISSDDEFTRMPPPDAARQLNEEQRELLRRWIEEGAKWSRHWSFIPPQRPNAPQVENAGWARGAIDRFILRKLEKEGLSPSPEADKATLIRRVTLDLTGLPPTPAEIDAFLADDSPNAYERLVDRLLASPRYGEHMAWAWLDAARYADTNGYQQDRTRTMWFWRDWVVRALNENMPFDRFTVEQIAGDLLPEATREQKIATGFNRNHMLNGEGGRIAEESRVEYVVDRVDTTSTVWLGLTVGCARCHDHKYDPISQEEFYRIYAYFNNIDETGRVDRGGNAAPVMKVPTRRQRERVERLEREIAQLQRQIREYPQPSAEAQANWEQEAKDQLQGEAHAWLPLQLDTFASRAGQTLELWDDGSIFVSGKNPDNDDYTLTATIDAQAITGLRLEALAHESFTNGGIARSDSGNFVLTEIEVEAGGEPVKIASASADYEQGGYPIERAFDGDPQTGWAVYKPGDMANDRTAVFQFEQPLSGGADTSLTIRLKHQSVHKKHNLGRFRLSITSAPEPSLDGEIGFPAAVVSALQAAPADRTPRQREALAEHFRRVEQQPLREQLEKKRQALAKLKDSFAATMVMRERDEPRQTYVLQRGQYDQYGEEVQPGTPQALHPPPDDAPANRLGFARWVVDPANPLTARVTVNRYWQQFFGTGLVKTTEDFGAQGERPSHPELLDWLAKEFVASGWNVKHVHRLIVTSAAYRQASHVTPELRERDPQNRLLARAPRYRLPSHVIRDQALALSGLLTREMGGPGVKPYQPPGIWAEFSFDKIKYEQDHGADLYRRGLYVFWRRSVGPTTLFDTASRQVCMVRPSITNTPLHALTLLNDTAYLEAARKFAARMMTEGGESSADCLAWGFRAASGRPPTSAEIETLQGGLARTRTHFEEHIEEAKELLAVGESPRDDSLPLAEHAAYSAVANLILNLDEVISKE